MDDYHPESAELTPKLREALADGKIHGMDDLMKVCQVDKIMDIMHVLHEMRAAGEVAYHAHGRWQKQG